MTRIEKFWLACMIVGGFLLIKIDFGWSLLITGALFFVLHKDQDGN